MQNAGAAYGTLQWWKRRLFGPGRWLFTIIEFIGFVGVIPVVFDLLRFVNERTEQPPASIFRSYLYLTFVLIVLLGGLYLLLYKKVHIDLKEGEELLARVREEAQTNAERLQKSIDVRDRGIVVQHQMAEEVRACAALKSAYDCQTQMQRVVSALVEYVRARLHGRDGGHIAVTVKHLVRKEDGDRLVTIFRDAAQDLTARSSGNEIAVSASHIYTSFIAETDDPRRWVMVRDAQALPGSEKAYKARADVGKFRSVLAFPLRKPVLRGQGGTPMVIKYANLFGFLSIDSSEPDAFDDFFIRQPRSGQARNDGENLDACADIELFYGIADSIATILMLRGAVPHPNVEGQNPNG